MKNDNLKFKIDKMLKLFSFAEGEIPKFCILIFDF